MIMRNSASAGEAGCTEVPTYLPAAACGREGKPTYLPTYPLGWRLTYVTDGDDSAENGVLAGGGENPVRTSGARWGKGAIPLHFQMRSFCLNGVSATTKYDNISRSHIIASSAISIIFVCTITIYDYVGKT